LFGYVNTFQLWIRPNALYDDKHAFLCASRVYSLNIVAKNFLYKSYTKKVLNIYTIFLEFVLRFSGQIKEGEHATIVRPPGFIIVSEYNNCYSQPT